MFERSDPHYKPVFMILENRIRTDIKPPAKKPTKIRRFVMVKAHGEEEVYKYYLYTREL